MKQFFKLRIAFLLAVTFSFLAGCNEKMVYNGDGEKDKYDQPDKAAEFEYNRTKNPVTGQVDRQKMWEAILQTQQLKDQNRGASNNFISALTWTERGSYTDAVGPSNGNQRPGNGVTSGRIRAIWVDLADPTGKTVWVGGVAGGLWKTTDITASPATWVLINDFLSNLAVSGICQDPTNTNTMYFCTGEAFFNGGAVFGNGVFKSLDHGVTWAQLSSTTTLTRCSKILCDAAGNVYVSTIGISAAVGLQRSSDGGTTWTGINPFVTSRVTDFEISSTGTMHVCAGLFSAAANTGYRYTTTPATVTTSTWTTPTVPFTVPSGTGASPGGTRTELACAGNTVYAALAHTNAANTTSNIDSIAKSTDGGATWVTNGLTTTNINDLNGTGGGQGWYSIGLGVDPGNPNNVIVGSLNCLKSTDGGVTFSKISEWVGTTGQFVHADQHNITWYDNGNKLLVGCDGGIHYSANGGTIFSDRNVNLRLKQFYSLAIHPSSTNYFLGGTQDNGVHQLNGPGLTSSVEVTGGDGGYVGIDQDEPQFQAGAYVFSNFRRSANSGATWSSGPGNNNGQFINAFDYDNLNNKIYAGYNAGQYLRWEDPHTGFTYSFVSIPAFNAGSVTAVTSSPYTSNRVYFGTAAGRVVQVDNAQTATPTDVNITPAGLTGYVNSVVIGTSDQNLITTVTSTGVTNVWSSTNGGTSWTACDGNLPDLPVYWALFNPDDNTKAYIATEAGIWSTDLLNGAATIWVAETTFPTVKTVMLNYRSSDRLIGAVTHGRGLWTAILPSTCTAASITSQPSNSTICTGANTSFTVVAAGSPTLTYQWQLSTAGAGGPWNIISNGGVYSNATTATLNITGALITMSTYQYRCVVTGNCAPLTVNSNPGILTVNAATNISGQPLNSTICAGANTSFSVTATGSSLTYQWQLSTAGAGGPWNNISNGGVYSNATTATLNITGALIGMNTYQYRCVVSGTCAPLSVNSSPGILTVNAATNISGQPVNNAVCIGGNTSFSVTATGTTLTYQWQESINGGGTWNNITNGGIYSNATTTTLNLTGVTAGMNNYQYRCVVNGTCGSANSTAGILTVNTAPAITVQPAASVITCAGNTATFSITATGSSVTYQWQESTDGGGSWNNLSNVAPYSGVTTTTLNINPTVVGMNGYQYRCIVTGVCPPSPLTSNVSTLTVSAAMSVTAQPANAAVCAGANTSFTINTSGTVTGYQWQESINGGGTWNNITNGGIYSNATTATLNLTGVTAGMNNYQYRCVISGNCPSINSNAAILTVNTAHSITSDPANSTICSAQSTSFSIAATGTVTSYQWQVSTAGCAGPWVDLANGAPYSGVTTATLAITNATTAINGYGYRCNITGPCAALVSSNCGLLTVNAAVNISAQPVASTVCAGLNTSFSVTATGSSLTYQWQESINGGGTWNNITNGGIYSNATTGTLNLTGVTAGMNNYQYRCVVSGAAPCVAANSNAAVLTVFTSPVFTSQPANSTICATQNTTFNVTATGTAVTYQWQVSTTGCAGVWADLVNGAPYSGVTSATLNISGATTALNGYVYRCVLTGTCAPMVTSNCVLLTVNTPINVTTQPVNAIVCTGQNTSFNVAVTGTSPTYQWQESINGGGTWNNISNGGIYSNATTATLNLTGVTAGMNNYQYRCIVSGTAPCAAANSNAAVLTVNTAPNITAQPVNSTICVSQTTSFSVTATGTAVTYQWQESITGCGGAFVNVTNGGVYSGATTATLTITGAPATMNGYGYRCIVTGTCAPAATSNCGLLTVNAAVNISLQPVNSVICAGANTSFIVAATGSGLTYQWQESINGGSTWNNIANGGIYGGATTTTLTLTGVTAGMNTYQYRCVVSGGAGCTSATSTAGILTVNTAPNISTQPANTTICATQNTSFAVVASGTAITYQWQESTTGCGGAFANVANGGVYSGATTATLTITGAPTTMNGYGYRCVINGTCVPAATSNCGLLTVNTPVNITTQPVNATVCAGTNTSFSIAVTGTSPTFQWQESTNGGGTWNNISNGGIYSGATTNTLNLTGVTAGMNNNQYRCVVSGATACASANSGAAILSVNTGPAITAQPLNTTVCGGQNTSYSVTANGTGLTYQWQLSTDGGGIYNNLANGGVYAGVTTATLTITGATPAMSTYRYRCIVSGTCNPAATSTAAILTVYTPISITTAPANATICATGTTSFSVVAAGTLPTYQWQESINGGVTWNNITNGGIYSGAATPTLTLTGVTAGMNGYQYRTAVSGSAPCGVVNTASASLAVSPQPTVTLTASPYTRLRPGLPVNPPVTSMVTTTITATVTPPTGFTTVWTWNNTPITVTGNAYSVDLNHLGTYIVIATIGSCTSLPASIVIGDSASNNLWVYPSPNNGQFTVSYYVPGASPTNKTTQKLTIYGSDGRRAYNNEFTVSQPYQLHQIDLRSNGGGVYYIVLREANGNKVRTGEVVVK